MYYDTEEALDGSNFDLLARRLSCKTAHEKRALQFVLDEFFDLDTDAARYVHHRCERELDAYRAAQAQRGELKKSVNKRQTVHRQQRSAMYAALRARGVHLAWNACIADVRAAFNEHCADTDVDLSRTSNAHVTANQSPKTNPLKPNIPPSPPGVTSEKNETENETAQTQDVQNAVVKLAENFPEKRRTRLHDVANLLADVIASEQITFDQLLTSAQSQSASLNADDGRSCPTLLRWLREKRWLDTGCASVANALPADWMKTKSGIENMAKLLGMDAWEPSPRCLFSDYEKLVLRNFHMQQQQSSGHFSVSA